MEREIKSEEVKKVSVSKIKDYFSEESLRFDDYVLSPLVRFKTMTGEPRVIEGMTVGVICNVRLRRSSTTEPSSCALTRCFCCVASRRFHRFDARRLVPVIL